MKRTLLRTWKILLTWLFVCYELGSLMDYLFFSCLNAGIFVLSWILHVVVYSIKFFFNSLWFLISFVFHFIWLVVIFFLPFVIDYCDVTYVFICKETYFLWSTFEISVSLVWSDVCSKLWCNK